MFNKLFSLITALLFVLSTDANAQQLGLCRSNVVKKNSQYIGSIIRSSSVPLETDESWLGYVNNELDGTYQIIGYNQVPFSYNVATCFPKDIYQFIGKSINGVKFSFASKQNIGNVKVWMSTELPATPEEANILCQSVSDITGFDGVNDYFNEVRFNEPYKFDGTKDMYVGYSFDVLDGDGDYEHYPILLNNAVTNYTPLFLYYNNEWTDYGYNENFGALALQLLVGDIHNKNAAYIPHQNNQFNIPSGKSFELPVIIKNFGTEGVSNIDINVNIDGVSTNHNVVLENPAVKLDEQFIVRLPLELSTEPKSNCIKLSIDKVNGELNEIDAVFEFYVNVLSELVPHKVFYEDIVDFSDMFSPRGYVSEEILEKSFGDDIAIVSVHPFDDLACADYNIYALPIFSFLGVANLDRESYSVDPYNGNFDFNSIPTNNHMPMSDYVEYLTHKIPVAEVTPSYTWNDDVLTASASVRFLYNNDNAYYRLAYFLVEDGMSNEKWLQQNIFNGQTIDGNNNFDFWLNSAAIVNNYTYNNVLIAADGAISGIEGSIPTSIRTDEIVNHETKFDLNNYPVIQNRENLRLIVVLYSANSAVNCNSIPLGITTGVDGVAAHDNEIKVVARYNADGSRIAAPQKGINIVKYSDGNVKKVVVR